MALERIDGHALVVNGEALRRAGPAQWSSAGLWKGGKWCSTRTAFQQEFSLTMRVNWSMALFRLSRSRRGLEALMDAQANLLAHGIVGVTDAGLSPVEIERIDALQQSGALKLRVNALVSASDDNIAWLVDSGRRIDDWLVVNGVKFYMDGALGSRGALLRQPYSDRTGWFGLATQREQEFRRQIETLHGHGLQAATHCIGDSGHGPRVGRLR